MQFEIDLFLERKSLQYLLDHCPVVLWLSTFFQQENSTSKVDLPS
jgi:hypothetical protein